MEQTRNTFDPTPEAPDSNGEPRSESPPAQRVPVRLSPTVTIVLLRPGENGYEVIRTLEAPRRFSTICDVLAQQPETQSVAGPYFVSVVAGGESVVLGPHTGAPQHVEVYYVREAPLGQALEQLRSMVIRPEQALQMLMRFASESAEMSGLRGMFVVGLFDEQCVSAIFGSAPEPLQPEEVEKLALTASKSAARMLQDVEKEKNAGLIIAPASMDTRKLRGG